MSAVTVRLHRAFLDGLGHNVIGHSVPYEKPLEVDLALPLPRYLRVYLYSLVSGGKRRSWEYKAVLRVPGQVVGEYGSFEQSDDRLVVLAAYRKDLDVFVLWDASLRERFKHGGNVQVKDTVVTQAAAIGWSEQRRELRSGITEIVFACRSSRLRDAIAQRSLWTGGILT